MLSMLQLAQMRAFRYYLGIVRGAATLYSSGREGSLEALEVFDHEWPQVRSLLEALLSFATKNIEVAELCWEFLGVGAPLYDLRITFAERLQHLLAAKAAAARFSKDRVQARIQRQIGWAQFNLKQYDAAMGSIKLSLRAATECGDLENQCKCHGALGSIYREMGDYLLAKDAHFKAVQLAREVGNRKLEGEHLGNVGNDLRNLDRNQEALPYYLDALKIHQEVRDRRSEGIRFGNIGLVHSNLGEYPEAKADFEQALRIAAELGDDKNRVFNLGSLATTLQKLGKFGDAVPLFTEAVSLAQKLSDSRLEGWWLGKLGCLYQDMGEFGLAERFMRRALDIAVALHDRCYEGTHLSTLGSLYMKLGRLTEGRECLERSVALAKDLGIEPWVKIREEKLARLAALESAASAAELE